ncbi:hypothetical protein M7I_3179 [Glarea lozoyensis 74030]|uniref:Uncharacterized protein n=1 Tax=Glarea lozoyensis (strain ATCC 74030 / MF5533) TaxID=1104152 RepID=H0EKU6_GLAL7|nr:hypothetical protein M7I_3179 [Glarea lozoyensis 74030]
MDSNWKYASSDVGADHRKKATTQQVQMDKMKEHTKRMHSFAKPENPTIPLLVADEPRATPTSFDTRHYGINSQYNLMSRENAFIDETPYIQQQQMYSASGSSSSEVAWNQNHPSFFDEVVRDMEGLSDWTGEGQYEDEQYDYKDNVKVEDSGRNYATHRYERILDNSSTRILETAALGPDP